MFTKQKGVVTIGGKLMIITLALMSVSLSGIVAECKASQMSILEWLKQAAKPYAGTTIRILGNNNMTSQDIKPFGEIFEKATGIKLEWDIYKESAVVQKSGIELAGGSSAYDVMWSAKMQNFRYVKAGWLTPLEGYINDPSLTNPDVLNLGDFLGDFLAACKGYDGKFYGLPNLAATKIMYYRGDTFAKFGVSVPDTLDELVDVCDKIQTSARAATAFDQTPGGHANVWIFKSLMYGLRGGLFADYPKDMHPILDHKTNVEALEMWTHITRECSIPGAMDVDFDRMIKEFQEGRGAILIYGGPVGAWVYKESKDAENIHCALVPRGPGGRWPGFDSQMWVIPKNAKNKEAAYLWIMWATSPETLALATTRFTTAVPRKSVFRSPEYLENFPFDNGQFASIFAESLEIAHSSYNPDVAEHPEIAHILGIAISEAASGITTPAEALRKAQSKAYKLMKEVGYKI